jgi:MFS family permease
MIAEHGVVGSAASIMVSAYAMGMLVGRFVSGYALDRFSPRVVATLGLSLSAFGLLAMSFVGGSIIGLALAVLAIGFSFGAESDILGFLIHRHFGTRIYGSVAGMLASTVAISSTLGAGGLSFVLHETNSYRPFLFVTGLCVLVGGLLLLLLPRHGSNIDEAEERADDHADAAGPAHAA